MSESSSYISASYIFAQAEKYTAEKWAQASMSAFAKRTVNLGPYLVRRCPIPPTGLRCTPPYARMPLIT